MGNNNLEVLLLSLGEEGASIVFEKGPSSLNPVMKIICDDYEYEGYGSAEENLFNALVDLRVHKILKQQNEDKKP